MNSRLCENCKILIDLYKLVFLSCPTIFLDCHNKTKLVTKLVVLFTVLWFKWSVKKHCIAKVLLVNWETFLHENNRNYNSCKFSYKFTFVPFLSFLRNEKHDSSFHQVGGLVTRNISFFFFLFIACHALFQSHAEFNRLLYRNFLTCYSCSYYSSMVKLKLKKIYLIKLNNASKIRDKFLTYMFGKIGSPSGDFSFNLSDIVAFVWFIIYGPCAKNLLIMNLVKNSFRKTYPKA